MQVNVDFQVEGEVITVKFTPQDPHERVVCGALYKTSYYDQYINEDGSYEIHFNFKDSE